jgi:hypothetical protein
LMVFSIVWHTPSIWFTHRLGWTTGQRNKQPNSWSHNILLHKVHNAFWSLLMLIYCMCFGVLRRKDWKVWPPSLSSNSLVQDECKNPPTIHRTAWRPLIIGWGSDYSGLKLLKVADQAWWFITPSPTETECNSPSCHNTSDSSCSQRSTVIRSPDQEDLPSTARVP